MRNLVDLFHREPVLVTGLVEALVGLLAAFGLVFSGLQIAATVAFAAALIAVGKALYDRSNVSPVSAAPRASSRRPPSA